MRTSLRIAWMNLLAVSSAAVALLPLVVRKGPVGRAAGPAAGPIDGPADVVTLVPRPLRRARGAQRSAFGGRPS